MDKPSIFWSPLGESQGTPMYMLQGRDQTGLDAIQQWAAIAPEDVRDWLQTRSQAPWPCRWLNAFQMNFVKSLWQNASNNGAQCPRRKRRRGSWKRRKLLMRSVKILSEKSVFEWVYSWAMLRDDSFVGWAHH